MTSLDRPGRHCAARRVPRRSGVCRSRKDGRLDRRQYPQTGRVTHAHAHAHAPTQTDGLGLDWILRWIATIRESTILSPMADDGARALAWPRPLACECECGPRSLGALPAPSWSQAKTLVSQASDDGSHVDPIIRRGALSWVGRSVGAGFMRCKEPQSPPPTPSPPSPQPTLDNSEHAATQHSAFKRWGETAAAARRPSHAPGPSDNAVLIGRSILHTSS